MPESQHALQDTAAIILPCMQKVATGPIREHLVCAGPPGLRHPERAKTPRVGTVMVRCVQGPVSAHDRFIG